MYDYKSFFNFLGLIFVFQSLAYCVIKIDTRRNLDFFSTFRRVSFFLPMTQIGRQVLQIAE